VFHTNLNGKGPDTDAEEGIRISNLGSHEGTKFDLLVNSITGKYEAPEDFYQYNSVFGNFAYIIVGMKQQMDLSFTVVKAGTKDPLVLPKWYITFFDLDKSVATDAGTSDSGSEKIAVTGFSKYLNGDTSNRTQLIVTEHDPAPGYTSFEATKWGNTDDNPNSPMNLNDDQKQKAVTFEFKDTATFMASFTVSGCFDARPDDNNCTSAREVFFAGKSQLALDPCKMSPPPSGAFGEKPPKDLFDKLDRQGYEDKGFLF